MSVLKSMPKLASAALILAAGLAASTPSFAQLKLQNSPIRVQVGNGPTLIGSSTPNSGIGVSILSNQVGTHNGTSIRLLGDETIAGLNTNLLGTNGSGETTLLLSLNPTKK
ncbi:hypothetical protein SAMN05518849_10313 [Sphingobium sp. AP50]|uniref:hypothetical protein n=1 Tax=Sphingobium sp. AP50 TaxID=1884369 RepID=UPI0008BC393C|nr:hypothetical protein [Sphingobium sp. AP50]SEJ11415.1 hypothetical protein SAMN05518849_10313 [Sphingobium sp. AP50]